MLALDLAALGAAAGCVGYGEEPCCAFNGGCVADVTDEGGTPLDDESGDGTLICDGYGCGFDGVAVGLA